MLTSTPTQTTVLWEKSLRKCDAFLAEIRVWFQKKPAFVKNASRPTSGALKASNKKSSGSSDAANAGILGRKFPRHMGSARSASTFRKVWWKDNVQCVGLLNRFMLTLGCVSVARKIRKDTTNKRNLLSKEKLEEPKKDLSEKNARSVSS